MLGSTSRTTSRATHLVAQDSLTFYSGKSEGISNCQRAIDAAKNEGAGIIDNTPGGKYLESLDLYGKYDSKLADLPWTQASKAFAQGVKGKANAFAEGALPERVYHTTERPVLESHPNVTDINYRKDTPGQTPKANAPEKATPETTKPVTSEIQISEKAQADFANAELQKMNPSKIKFRDCLNST